MSTPSSAYAGVRGGVKSGASPLTAACTRRGVGVVSDLAATYRVYAPDLRGQGQSDWPGEYSFELIRDDVLGLLDALELTGATLVGHSAGGTVACLVAQERPARLVRLVLEDSPPPWPGSRPVPIPPRPAEPLPYDWQVFGRYSDS